MSTSAWIPSAQPPGVAATESAALEVLRCQHQRALRLLGLLRDCTAGMKTLSRNDVGTICDIFRYLVMYVDTDHHAREDIVVDALLAKDPALQAVLEPFNLAHRGITRDGAALLRELESDKRPDAGLLGRISRYSELLREHFAAEEAELFPLAAARLDESDWTAIHASLAGLEDPVFGPEVESEFARLFDHYVNLVREVGRAPGRFCPHAAAAVIEGTGAVLGGFKEGIAAVRFGARRMVDANVSGATQVMRSRGATQAATALREWAQEGRRSVATTIRLISHAADHACQSTIAPLSALGTRKRSFDNSYRVDKRRPSWQAHMVNLGLRATVKRMLSTGDVDNLRGGAPAVERLMRQLPSDVIVTHIELSNAHAEIFEVDGQGPERTILHLPGGGFLFPATQIHRLMAARLARIAQARVMLVHYRLAPEHPFPAGLDDCVEAYHYLLDQGVPPPRITISGDSAGGGLTLSTLLRLRQAGAPMPASAVLLSPLADLSNTGASRLDNRWYDPMLPLDRKNDLANLYLRDVPIDDPIASPLFGDLSGLPPLLIQVGSTEILLDDALRVAARVRATGGACEAEVWHDMPHAWILIGLLPEASRACERIARFIDEAGQPSSVRLDWAA